MFQYFLKIYMYVYNYLFKNSKESQQQYVTHKLNEWKVDLYTNNVFLVNIPSKAIYEKKIILEREYLDK